MSLRILLAAAGFFTVAPPVLAQDAAPDPGGAVEWIQTPEGRLKARVYSGAQAAGRPVLIVMLHGDIPDPQLNYHYYFSRFATDGAAAWQALPPAYRDAIGPQFASYLDGWNGAGLVAAGVTRPGYSDAEGDASDGVMGTALADNYTPEVVDAVAAAIASLREEYGAGAVILVGHSGGAAISANILGRHPDVADGALLIACGCDPVAWRAIARDGALPNQAWMKDLDWSHPYNSLSPLDTAAGVAPDTRVRMVIGENDEVVPLDHTRDYAALLEARGVDVTVTVAPGYDHNLVVFTPAVFDALRGLIADLRAGDPD